MFTRYASICVCCLVKIAVSITTISRVPNKPKPQLHIQILIFQISSACRGSSIYPWKISDQNLHHNLYFCCNFEVVCLNLLSTEQFSFFTTNQKTQINYPNRKETHTHTRKDSHPGNTHTHIRTHTHTPNKTGKREHKHELQDPQLETKLLPECPQKMGHWTVDLLSICCHIQS